jgi:SNF2 family DNA or RNA helicase
MKNTLKATFSKLELSIGNAADWPTAKRLTGAVKEITPGVFEMSLSTQNLQRIHRYFPGDKLPVVVGGQQFIDGLKRRLTAYKEMKARLALVKAEERYPVEPNGKFVPYAHQTKIIGTWDVNPYTPVCADCGTGKTGSTARAVELEMLRGNLTPGKTLISAPLSILDTSWADDIRKFTNLRCASLWTKITNKLIISEESFVLGDFGPKPPDVVSTKSKRGNWNRHQKNGTLKQKLDTMDGKLWDTFLCTWKEGTKLDGSTVIFGPLKARQTTKEETKKNWIKEQLARKDVDVFLINHDGVRIHNEILKENDLECVVVDESTKIKSPTSDVFRAHIDISWKAKRRAIMSGTPNPNGFQDLWAQFYFLDRGLTLEPSYKDFLVEYFTELNLGFMTKNKQGIEKAAVKYVMKDPAARDRLIERVQSVGIFIEQRDCLDLPARTDMSRVAFMTAEQEEAYVEMSRSLVAELRDSHTNLSVVSEAKNALSKILRLREITGGFLTNSQGERVRLSSNPKYEDLDALLDEMGDKKLIVACQFREEIEQLLIRYKHLGACAVYGDVKKEDRSDNIRLFQTDPSVRMIVLHPQAAAHGITLTASAHLLFLSLSYNYEHYYQIAKRTERLGQVNPIFILHSVARFSDGTETIDEILMDVLKGKDADRNALFNPTDLPEIATHVLERIIKQVEGA